MKIKNYVLRIKKWIKENQTEAIVLLLILALAAFLRLFRIDEYMTFLADEGRDVLIVRKLLVDGDLIFVGPGTSIGTMYLGPLYYYMMAPALLLANFSPVGPAVMIALLGVLTVFFLWYVARTWFGKVPAFIVSFLYATSPTVIIFSRSSWNPNIMPFFALLSIFSIWKVYKEQKFTWLIFLGVSFAFVLQSHYLGLLLLPILLVYWILANIKVRNLDKVKRKNFLISSLFGLGFFTLLMLPLVLFDLKHDLRNFRAMISFATGSNENYSFTLLDTAKKTPVLINFVFTRVFAAKNLPLGTVSSLIVMGSAIFIYLKRKNTEVFLLFLWIFVGASGLALLRQEVYEHYAGFLFPVPFLLTAAVYKIILKNKLLAIFGIFGAIVVSIFNFYESPFKFEPNRLLLTSRLVAEKILEESGGREFHLAAIADTNNRDTYLYHLIHKGAPVVDIDPQNYDDTLVDQLFVVCEKSEEDCDPTHNPSSWIVNFGWSKIEASWEVRGVTIYKLVHSEEWLQKRQ